jgi:transglutaminase-like putative cysteine protease
VAEGWDPTHDCRTDEAYITVAVGRDYADVAPLSGTYDGAAAQGTLTVSKRVWPIAERATQPSGSGTTDERAGSDASLLSSL